MMVQRILVVGATGQLGSEFTRQALEAGHAVRALVRPSSDRSHLQSLGAEIHPGDLKDAESLNSACRGVDVVVATATVVFPKGTYSFERDEELGYRQLVAACKAGGVRQIVFVSLAKAFHSPFLQRVPTVHAKLVCEKLFQDSGIDYTIFRAAPFMDAYVALVGSEIPLRDEPAATLDRARGLARLMRICLGSTIDDHGFALVPGKTTTRHSFIAVKNVATYLLRSIGNAQAKNAIIDIGGPKDLSWNDVCDTYSRLLGRKVRAVGVDARFFEVLARALRPFSQAASNQMGILWLLGSIGMAFDSSEAAKTFGVELTSADKYLTSKFAPSVQANPAFAH
jgi:uncharacterized protein YbjT (DUF2867 family)